jgi:glutaredoxin
MEETTELAMYEVNEMFTVYGALDCVFCERTKILLDHYKKNWRFVNVTEKVEYMEAFNKKTNNAKKVPQIFLYQTERGEYEVHIGGFNDLQAWLDNSYRIKGQHTRPVTNEWKGLI